MSKPYYVERNPVIVAARDAFLTGKRWIDDGSVDAAVAALVYEVMRDNPLEEIVPCIDAVVALRSAPAGDLNDRQLEARVRLDLRLQTPNDREKKRIPSSQAELERRGVTSVAIIARDDVIEMLQAALREALDLYKRDVVGLVDERISELRKLAGRS